MHQRGYIIPATLIIALVATTIGATMLQRMQGSIHSTAEVVRRRQAFYAADGIGRIAIEELEEYLINEPNPSTSELSDPANVPPPSIPGFTIEAFDFTSVADTYYGPIPNGNFQGMYAQQKPVDIHVEARHIDSGVVGEVDLRVLLGHIALFQFFLFSDDYTEFYPAADMTIDDGRIHANHDLCMGSGATFKVERVTASKGVYAGGGACRRTLGKGFWGTDGSTYQKMTESNDHGCSNCDGSGLEWHDYALNTWGGYIRDEAHGVNTLKLPLLGVPSVQSGYDVEAVEQSNDDSFRLLVDPPVDSDTDDILEQKYAWQADLRIINGVWYINDGSWPGRAIWSDHPGSFTTRNEENVEGSAPKAVGQADLTLLRGWLTRPNRYSYYEYDPLTGGLADNDVGVISYGTLFRRGAGNWGPGFWARGGGGATYTDLDGTQRDYFCNWCNNGDCSASLALRDAAESFCQAELPLLGYIDNKAAQYLQATRGGFTDQRGRLSSAQEGGILPMNFDVAAFVAALEDTSPGELGSYFSSSDPFNGIVYITNTWPGSMNGFPSGHPTLWPTQGAVGDGAQAASWATSEVQGALPWQLCSDTLGYNPGVVEVALSGPINDYISSNGYEPHFRVPACTLATTSRPNALRIHNAADIQSTQLPQGLSIVTNLPAYILGETNTTSDTSALDATPWVPFMVGADAVTLLSNAWRDDRSSWQHTGPSEDRPASNTTWNLAYVGGVVQTSMAGLSGGGIPNYPRFLETWSGVTARIRGSLVVGFASVYQYPTFVQPGPTYRPPLRDWSFDPHLKRLSHQPPGTPLMAVHAINRLHRR